MRPNRERWHALAVAALAACLVGAPAAFAAEGDAQYDYRFGWEESSRGLAAEGGETPEGESTAVPFTVDVTNLTALKFTLEWTDDVGDPDTLRVVVFDADGNEAGRASDSQSNGTLDVIVRVQEMPPGTVTVRAGGDAEAWAVFRSDYPASGLGRGEWTAEVTVVDAGDAEGPLGIGDHPDDGQAWNLTLDAGAYAGVLVSRTVVENPREEPPSTPDEMPPVDEEPPVDESPPEESRATSVLSSRGAQSALVVVAAAVGIAGALLLARRSSA